MEQIPLHNHNDINSPKIFLGDSAVNAPQESVTVISGTAGASYTTSEQAMLNEIKASLNDLITKLQTLGILK